MLTENGSVKTKSVEVASALDLYRKKLKIISLVMLIVGAIGLALYIALSTIFEIKWLDALLVFAVPFTLGLIGFITIKRLYKRELKEELSGTCEFFADCFFYSTENAQSAPITGKMIYSDAVLKRENEKFGYIFVFSKCLLLPFSKEDLSNAELNAIRKNFRKEVADGEATAKLEKYKENKDNNDRAVN